MTPDEYFSQPFWQDQFHWCAFRAYIEVHEKGSEAVRKKAYEIYEREKHDAK